MGPNVPLSNHLLGIDRPFAHTLLENVWHMIGEKFFLYKVNKRAVDFFSTPTSTHFLFIEFFLGFSMRLRAMISAKINKIWNLPENQSIFKTDKCDLR